MFCPKCASQNVDGASFCRSCGANISPVPQALSGKLPTAETENCVDFVSRRSRRREASIDTAARSAMMGVAFAAISILVGKYSPGGWTWWYWMLIPAAIFFSRGISDLLRLRLARNQPPTFAQPQLNTVRQSEFPGPRTSELVPPVPSVTEGTTRHLGVEAPTRHFDQPS